MHGNIKCLVNATTQNTQLNREECILSLGTLLLSDGGHSDTLLRPE